jgi:hypothetical protein
MLDIINDAATYGLSLIACVLVLFVTLGTLAEHNQPRTYGEVVQTFTTDGYTYKVVRE